MKNNAALIKGAIGLALGVLGYGLASADATRTTAGIIGAAALILVLVLA